MKKLSVTSKETKDYLLKKERLLGVVSQTDYQEIGKKLCPTDLKRMLDRGHEKALGLFKKTKKIALERRTVC